MIGSIHVIHVAYNPPSKKAPCLQAGDELQKLNIGVTNINSVPWGTGELKPDKPNKNGGRWSKTFRLYEEGTVDEAGTPHALAVGGCQNVWF